MKKNELRIGNWVDYFDSIHVVEKINKKSVRLVYLGDGTSTSSELDSPCLRPIELNGEILEWFGFTQCDVGHWYQDEDNDLYGFVERSGGYSLVVSDIDQKETYVKYAHQLQNLYFALTGEELSHEN